MVVCLVSLINMHNWDLSDYEMIIKDWIKILFNINDLSDSISRNQFIEWIDREATERFVFWESYMDCFNNEVSYIPGTEQVTMLILVGVLINEAMPCFT